eukprot:6181569-Pleurochrysis_carterae.AAC.6
MTSVARLWAVLATTRLCIQWRRGRGSRRRRGPTRRRRRAASAAPRGARRTQSAQSPRPRVTEAESRAPAARARGEQRTQNGCEAEERHRGTVNEGRRRCAAEENA